MIFTGVARRELQNDVDRGNLEMLDTKRQCPGDQQDEASCRNEWARARPRDPAPEPGEEDPKIQSRMTTKAARAAKNGSTPEDVQRQPDPT